MANVAETVKLAKALVGTRAALTSSEKKQGLCCYGVIWHCMAHLQDDLPAVTDVASLDYKRQMVAIAKHATRIPRPELGCVVSFRNHMVGRNRLSESHLAVVVGDRPLTVVHSDISAREVREDLLGLLVERGLVITGYWRPN